VNNIEDYQKWRYSIGHISSDDKV